MRRATLPAALLTLSAALLAGGLLYARSTPLRVMLTGFEPFDGRASNNSWNIANAVASAKEQLGPDVVVSTCLLPVVYDSAAKAAETCFDSAAEKPDVVISLGEAGCQLRIETAAHNLDDTPGFPDNAGNIRTGKTIEDGAPAHLGFNLPAPEMYCELGKKQRGNTQVSETPGGFVCNNTAFHLARYFMEKPVQYGFIHVPASDCGDSADPKKTAEPLTKMLKRLAAYDDAPVDPRTAALPHCENDARLPTTAGGVEDLLATLSDLSKKDCRRDFLERLKERL